jgi:hypothetical protein
MVGQLVDSSGTATVLLRFAGAGAIGAVAGGLMLETRNRRLEEIAT